MSEKKIIVIDDEKNITFVIKAILEKAGYTVDAYNDPVVAIAKLREIQHQYSVVITDLFMPKLNGMQILEEIKSAQPELPVIMITAFGTVESAVEAIKKGAFDYISKPFEQGEILNVVTKAVHTYTLNLKEPRIEESEHVLTQSLLVSKSVQMQEVMRIVHRVASSPSTVLITGESGTGKEVVALELHRRSLRSTNPFIRINCAAIPHSLIESELFGYEKGAFTGATTSKPGRFELADGGTLFLDEVAEMSLEMQVKLLRAIQESEFERVGGLETIKIDVRIVAATNKDILKEVKEGRFREDLYYRLNVVPIHLAPLRERRADIEDLIYYFLKKFNDRLQRKVETIEPDCLKSLLIYSWPGNIRQLENVLERATLMCDGVILKREDLPSEIQDDKLTDQSETDRIEIKKIIDAYQSGKPFKDIVKQHTMQIEKQIIEEALQENEGNITKTAEKLGLSRKGLQLKLKELGMSSQRTQKED